MGREREDRVEPRRLHGRDVGRAGEREGRNSSALDDRRSALEDGTLFLSREYASTVSGG